MFQAAGRRTERRAHPAHRQAAGAVAAPAREENGRQTRKAHARPAVVKILKYSQQRRPAACRARPCACWATSASPPAVRSSAPSPSRNQHQETQPDLRPGQAGHQPPATSVFHFAAPQQPLQTHVARRCTTPVPAGRRVLARDDARRHRKLRTAAPAAGRASLDEHRRQRRASAPALRSPGYDPLSSPANSITQQHAARPPIAPALRAANSSRGHRSRAIAGRGQRCEQRHRRRPRKPTGQSAPPPQGGHQRTETRRGRASPLSDVADGDDLVALVAARAPAPPRRRPLPCRSGRARSGLLIDDQAQLQVGFVLADDLVGDLVAGLFVFQVDRGAEHHLAAGIHRAAGSMIWAADSLPSISWMRPSMKPWRVLGGFVLGVFATGRPAHALRRWR